MYIREGEMNWYPYADTQAANSKNVSVRLFGNRIISDQTLYEFLIEFLLIFIAAKDKDGVTGIDSFHSPDCENMQLDYYAEPRIGLRRFVFYDKTKKGADVEIDEKAYNIFLQVLMDEIEDAEDDRKQEIIDSIQDMIHGYAAVVKSRFWGAQMLLPICRSFVYCEAMPNEKKRKSLKWDLNDEKANYAVDQSFAFDKRNFLARGGEVYYLHLLQGLKNKPEKKTLLEKLLRNLVNGQCKKMEEITQYLQSSWEKHMGYDKKKLLKHMPISAIPEDGYLDCAQYSVDELINFLSCSLDPVRRVEILAKGIMFQILRMMSTRVNKYLGLSNHKWIVDMKNSSDNTVRKIAADSFRQIEDDFLTALNKMASEMTDEANGNVYEVTSKDKRNSLEVFRSKGKEIQCIIPYTGGNERFTISEDVATFLVLSLLASGEKMTYKMFLDKLYTHYGIVIGSEEYRKVCLKNNHYNLTLAGSFTQNAELFQNFLESIGFLRSLSDATSIVVNPYTKVEIKE